MIEHILFGFLKLGDSFERSRDPDLEEFRHHQRVAIVASIVAVVALLMALLIGPSEPGTFGRYDPLVFAVQWPFGLTMAGISLIACLVVMWKAYCLWKSEAGFQ